MSEERGGREGRIGVVGLIKFPWWGSGAIQKTNNYINYRDESREREANNHF